MARYNCMVLLFELWAFYYICLWYIIYITYIESLLFLSYTGCLTPYFLLSVSFSYGMNTYIWVFYVLSLSDCTRTHCTSFEYIEWWCTKTCAESFAALKTWPNLQFWHELTISCALGLPKPSPMASVGGEIIGHVGFQHTWLFVTTWNKPFPRSQLISLSP